MSKIVLVEWRESNVTHGWRHTDDGLDRLAHCRTVGIVQFEDDTQITLAMGDSDSGAVLETIVIPRGCIDSIKFLRRK